MVLPPGSRPARGKPPAPATPLPSSSSAHRHPGWTGPRIGAIPGDAGWMAKAGGNFSSVLLSAPTRGSPTSTSQGHRGAVWHKGHPYADKFYYKLQHVMTACQRRLHIMSSFCKCTLAGWQQATNADFFFFFFFLYIPGSLFAIHKTLTTRGFTNAC